jgi:hypothetical protein
MTKEIIPAKTRLSTAQRLPPIWPFATFRFRCSYLAISIRPDTLAADDRVFDLVTCPIGPKEKFSN